MKPLCFATFLALAGVVSASPPADPIASDLLAAIHTNPKDATSMLRLGVHLQSQGRIDEGGVWVKAAYDADPSLVEDVFIDTAGTRGSACDSTGPDVIVGDLPGLIFAAHEGPAQNGISAYGIGTTSCNVGDEILLWQSGNPNHPVIAQNIYRLVDGRFSQVGIGWLKHGFLALSGNLCCTCMGPGGAQLSPGCSDPYSASLNASQSLLGPRFEVNAATGAFPYPFTSPAITSSIDRRCQVADADLNPALNVGARYFAEGHYVANDDAAAGNKNNNASYREIRFFQSGDGYNATTVGPTVRENAAIYAWAANDPNASVVTVDVPGDGRFDVGYAVTSNDDGTWHYEYAIHNMSSDRSAQALSIPIPAGITVTGAGFHDVSYHSGEPFDGSDWTFNSTSGFATWSTVPFSVNPNANALRWGTLYNFWFDADAAPSEDDGSITLFKSAAPRGVGTVTVALPVPAPPPCPEDVNGDTFVNTADYAIITSNFGPCPACPEDVNGDGVVDATDVSLVIARLGGTCMGCPEDVNGDGLIDNTDVGLVTAALGPCPSCPADVNGDGVVDAMDLQQAMAAGGPCKDCPADINDSGRVAGGDLARLLAAWGNNPGPTDLNGDSMTNGADLAILLAAWGPCP